MVDVLAFIKELFASGLSTLAQAGAKAVTGSGKDISGAAKDVTGIRRDIIETQLAGKKLEDLESMIQKATLEDVERFCPTTLKVIVNAERAVVKGYIKSPEKESPKKRLPNPHPRHAWTLDPAKRNREYLMVLNGYSEMVSQEIEQMMREENVDVVTVVLAIGTQVWVRESEQRVRRNILFWSRIPQA